MYRLTHFTALVVALALSMQVAARAACEVVCLSEIVSHGSRAAGTADVPQCHEADGFTTRRSASFVAADDECEHGVRDDSLGRQRSLASAERSSAIFASRFEILPGHAREGSSRIAPMPPPPGISPGPIAPLRL